MFASVKSRERHGTMQVRPSSDQDRINARVVNKVFPVGIDLADVEVARDAPRGIAGPVANGYNFDARKLLKSWKMSGACNFARADDPDPNLGRFHL
jgi:hypothetical protein